MKKVIFVFLLSVLLIGLSGCRTSRATFRTDTDRDTRLTEVTDSSRNQQTKTSDQINAALSSNEQQTVVIEFDEWEYYQPGDTGTAGNYAHNSPDFIRDGKGEADKPPNAGAVKRHKKGTITINGSKETKATATDTSTTETTVSETGSRETKKDEAVKEKTSRTEETKKGSSINAFAFGLIFALVAVIAIIYFVRRK